MISNHYKAILDTFITKEYSTIRDVAKSLYKDPDDLISKTYESIVNGNQTNWLEESFNTDRIYLYFYISLRNQRSNMYKDRQKLKYNELPEKLSITDLPDKDIEDYNNILELAEKLRRNKHINDYQHRIFILFYAPESIIKINKVDDIHSLRDMSLRKLENLTGINHVSIFYSIKIVVEKIKKKLNE